MFSVGKIVVFYMFVVTFDKIYGSFSLKIVGRKKIQIRFRLLKKKKMFGLAITFEGGVRI